MSPYAATLEWFVTNYHGDAALLVETDDAEDFGVRLIAAAYGKDPAQVVFDLGEKMTEMHPE